MMLYKNMKEMTHSADVNTNFFDIITGILQGNTFTRYLFIICLDYIWKTSIDQIKENGFTLKR